MSCTVLMIPISLAGQGLESRPPLTCCNCNHPALKYSLETQGIPLSMYFLCCAEQHRTSHSCCGGSRGELHFPTTTVASHAKSRAFMYLHLLSVIMNSYKVLRWRDCSFTSRCVLLPSLAARQLMIVQQAPLTKRIQHFHCNYRSRTLASSMFASNELNAATRSKIEQQACPSRSAVRTANMNAG